MVKKFVIIISAMLLSACSGSDYVDYEGIGDNGLPNSLSVFPHINNLKNTNAKPAQANKITMTIELENVDIKPFTARLVSTGFIHHNNDIYSEYDKDNAHVFIMESKLEDVTYQFILLEVNEPISDNHIEKFYSYFPPIPGNNKRISIEYVDLDPLSLDAYILMLENIGFQNEYYDEYWYGKYCFVGSVSYDYGHYVVISNSGSGLAYANGFISELPKGIAMPRK